MPIIRKRLLGVSFLACALLALGFFNTLAAAAVALSPHISIPWPLLLGSEGRSSLSGVRMAYLVGLTWMGISLCSIALGIGLWMSCNWARRGVLLAVSAVGSLSLCTLPLLAGQAWSAVVALLAALTPLEWIVWYLMRPRVRSWFHASRPDPAQSRSISQAGRIAIGAALALTACGLLFCVRFVTSEIEMHTSDAYRAGIESAQESPCVDHELGLPIKAGWIMSGEARENASDGHARLRIPVRGPKGHGDLEVEARKDGGAWTIRSLVLHSGSGPAQTLTEGAESGCE